MAKLSAEDYNTRDIYLYWSFEGALVKYDYKTKQFFKKFIDYEGEYKAPRHDKIVVDVRLYGFEITKEEYETGKIKLTDE